MYPKPAFFNANGNELLLNCGLCRERGTVRTSTTRDTSCTCSKRTNSASVRVEWPTVSTTGKSLVSGFSLRGRVSSLRQAFVESDEHCDGFSWGAVILWFQIRRVGKFH